MSRNVYKRIRVIKTNSHAIVPKYQTDQASGLDLALCLVSGDGSPLRRLVSPGEHCLLHTGLAIELPPGCEGQIRPRSSMSKQGLHVALGTIDNDYRGELKICVYNGNHPTCGKHIELKHGQRIAQLVVARYMQCVVEEVKQLSDTVRGTGGFGSTGE